MISIENIVGECVVKFIDIKNNEMILENCFDTHQEATAELNFIRRILTTRYTIRQKFETIEIVKIQREFSVIYVYVNVYESNAKSRQWHFKR